MVIALLFILESIGTQELILVGLVALIIFGPRKLPQMARKFGNMLTELRKVSNDFRQTWEREASLDEESFKSVPSIGPVTRQPLKQAEGQPESITDENAPEIRELSPEDFPKASRPAHEDSAAAMDPDPPDEESAEEVDDKRSWL